MKRSVLELQLRLIVVVVLSSFCLVQTAMPAGVTTPTVEQEQAASQGVPAAGTVAPTITVAPGTVVPMTLVSPIKSKSTKVGDTVRAQVAFPITVGERVAIPAGTYVEGVVTSLTAQAKKTRQPVVEIHFTRLVYANGYTAAVDAANTQASNEIPGTASPVLRADSGGMAGGGPRTAFFGGEGQFPTQPPPTLQPLPQVGPSKALVFGVVGGVTVALLTLGIVFGHRNRNTDFVLFDAGWQFQMAITTPLGVDAGQVAAAAAVASH
jgi:type IV secretion system protein VirB10